MDRSDSYSLAPLQPNHPESDRLLEHIPVGRECHSESNIDNEKDEDNDP